MNSSAILNFITYIWFIPTSIDMCKCITKQLSIERKMHYYYTVPVRCNNLKKCNTLIEDGTCRYVYVYLNCNDYVFIRLKIIKKFSCPNYTD